MSFCSTSGSGLPGPFFLAIRVSKPKANRTLAYVSSTLSIARHNLVNMVAITAERRLEERADEVVLIDPPRDQLLQQKMFPLNARGRLRVLHPLDLLLVVRRHRRAGHHRRAVGREVDRDPMPEPVQGRHVGAGDGAWLCPRRAFQPDA